MSSRILYQCTCAAHGTCELEHTLATGAATSALALDFSPLSSLYYCPDCACVRCNECIAWEVIGYFCPSCLFEVPSTSVKAQKSRCARNCFECPSCTHVLSLVGSDSPQSAPLTSTEASKGVPPYYLYCTCCRWDSKRLGIAFDTPSGLNAHLQPREANLPEQLEFDHLCKHWAPLMKMNMDIVHARTHGPPRSATAPGSSRHRHSQQSQLLREVLHLPTRYLDGGRAPTRRQPAEPMDVVPPYKPVAARTQNKLETRKARRWRSLAEHTTTDASNGSGISTLEQRWSMPIDQPYETGGLRPQRVRLLAKLCKRCPSCRRILVRPELHTSSSRFKVRLLAADHLPGVQVERTPVPSGSDAGAVCTVTLTNPALEPMRVALQVDGTSSGVRAELATGSLQLRPSLEALDVEEEAPLERVADGVHLRRNTAMVEVRLRGDDLRRPLQLALRLTYRVGDASHGAVEEQRTKRTEAQTTVLLALEPG